MILLVNFMWFPELVFGVSLIQDHRYCLRECLVVDANASTPLPGSGPFVSVVATSLSLTLFFVSIILNASGS